MFQFIYDLLVWISTHYSDMSPEFKKRFPEKFFIRGRLDVGSINAAITANWCDYEYFIFNSKTGKFIKPGPKM